MRIPGKQSTHLVIRDGIFAALIAELVDGNYVILRPGDQVYLTVEEARNAAMDTDGGGEGSAPELSDGNADSGSEDWFPDQ